MNTTNLHIIARNDEKNDNEQISTEIALNVAFPDTLTAWKSLYFNSVTTAASSRQVQSRDIQALINFVIAENGNDARQHWTPRLSRAFLDSLKSQVDEAGKRRYVDRTINRILTHNKTFAKFIQGLRAFPLGDPMQKLKLIPVSAGLEVERALTKIERRRLLDAADLLARNQGISKDRNRYSHIEDRPKRKRFRPYRNRAIIYTLIETGMRRAAIKNLNFESIDFVHKQLKVEEKGGFTHAYQISTQGLEAISDYLEYERGQDEEYFTTNALFLASGTTPRGDGRLSVRLINLIWNEVATLADVEGKTPHSARHSMGKHIIEKTGNIAAVQKQLGHKNAVYSMQYARITKDELKAVLDDRE